MKESPPYSRSLPWLAAAAGLAAGWGLGKWPGEAREQAVPMAGKSLPRGEALTRGQGSAMLADWGVRVEDTPDAALPELAGDLAQDGRRHDPALWMPLIARWSESDAPGMIALLETDAPPALRDRLLDSGWFAWGAVDPDLAFEAGRALPQERMRRLLEGVVEADPEKAAGFVTRVPDSQFAAWSIGEKISREALLALRVYKRLYGNVMQRELDPPLGGGVPDQSLDRRVREWLPGAGTIPLLAQDDRHPPLVTFLPVNFVDQFAHRSLVRMGLKPTIHPVITENGLPSRGLPELRPDRHRGPHPVRDFLAFPLRHRCHDREEKPAGGFRSVDRFLERNQVGIVLASAGRSAGAALFFDFMGIGALWGWSGDAGSVVLNRLWE